MAVMSLIQKYVRPHLKLFFTLKIMVPKIFLEENNVKPKKFVRSTIFSDPTIVLHPKISMDPKIFSAPQKFLGSKNFFAQKCFRTQKLVDLKKF